MANPKESTILGMSAVGAPPRTPEAPPASVPVRKTEVRPALAPEPGKRPETRRTLIQKLTRSLALRLAALSIIFGGGAAATAYGINPAFHEEVNSGLHKIGINVGETRALLYDPASLKPQEIKAGPNGNARAATPEAIQGFIDQKPPIFPTLEELKPGEQAPKIEILMPINPENTKNIKIVQERVDTKGGNKTSTDYYYFSEPNLYVKGDAPFALPLVAGAKTVEIKVAINQFRGTDIKFTFTLNDGQIVRGELAFWDDKYIPTDILRNLPTYNPNIINNTATENAIPGQKFDLGENSYIPLFTTSESTHISLMYRNGQLALNPTFKTDEGKVLYQSSPK